MKKILLTITSITFTNLVSQTLTQSTHAPAIGDIYLFRNANKSSLPNNWGNPGSGNTFNFSGLNVLSMGGNTIYVVSPVSTGSAAAYPNANVATSIIGMDRLFYNSQSGFLDCYGGEIYYWGAPFIINYSSPERLGVYPMTLGTTYTNTLAGTISFLGNTGTLTGVCGFTADATGTIVLPGGLSYTNIIRIHTQEHISYSGSLVGSIAFDKYDYYAPGYSNYPNPNNNFALLSIKTFTVVDSTMGGGVYMDTGIVVNKNYQTLQVGLIDHAGNHLILSPNPAQNELNIQLNTQNTIKHISVMDVSGKIVDELKDNNGKIDCSLLSNGIYFIRLEDNEGKIYTEKFVVQH